MSGINRLQSKLNEVLGLNEWGQRVLIPGTMDDEIVETNQQFGAGTIPSSKIKNLKVDTITITPTGYIRLGKDSFTDSTNAGYYFDANGMYVGAASDANYLKYDVSAGTLVFKGSITGSTITGGTLQTATSGDRVVITGNDSYFYDATTGGGGTITGNVASIFFPRTDGANGQFVIQKRKSTVSNNGNVMELFFTSRHATADNYLFLGRSGNISDTRYTDVSVLFGKSLIQMETLASVNRSTPPEITLFTAKAPGVSNIDDDNTSKLILSAVDGTNGDTWSNGGATVAIGIQLQAGFGAALIVDRDGLEIAGMKPFTGYTNTFDIGSASLRFKDTHSKYFYGDRYYINGDLEGYLDNSSGTLRWNGTAVGTGTVTSVATSGAISGGTITTTGTISHSTSAGYKHIPSGGTTYYTLYNTASGTVDWTRAIYIGNSSWYFDYNANGIVTSKTLLAPSAAGASIGSSTLYFDEVNYKTLTDRGCLGWFDEGVELIDGTIVSDMESIQAIQKHPTEKTIYGADKLDYKTFPKVCYVKAKDKDGKDLPRDKNDKPYEEVIDEKGIKKILPAEDGIEMTSLFSIMIGTLKELDNRLKIIENNLKIKK